MPAPPDRILTHVDFGNDYGKVHRLREPTVSLALAAAKGTKTACGRTYRGGNYSAAWSEYDENSYGFCSRCKGVLDRARTA